MKLTTRCAYCSQTLTLIIKDATIKQRDTTLGPPVLCPTCGSRFTLELSTKRKSKGKTLKALEVRAAAEMTAKVEAARLRNAELGAELGAELLAEPGCTCGARLAKQHSEYGYSWTRHNNTGHDLATSISNGIPNPPAHLHGCPCHPTHKTITDTTEF